MQCKIFKIENLCPLTSFSISSHLVVTVQHVTSGSGTLTQYTKPTAAPSADGFYTEGDGFEYHLGH
jgi:hypothetical protein